jgi:hypothetical protein
VKYAQCVKIWLFLKCVQFLKSCISSRRGGTKLVNLAAQVDGRHAL